VQLPCLGIVRVLGLDALEPFPREQGHRGGEPLQTLVAKTTIEVWGFTT
jgi:hypothetical protein